MVATLTNSKTAAALVLVATLVGCGRVTPTWRLPQAPVVAVEPPAPITPEPVMAPVAMPVQAQMPPVNPVSAGCEAANGCNPHLQLVVAQVQKKKAGFLWRKLRVQTRVTNRGPQPLDGEIIIRFKKNGQVVQSEFVAFALLPPGQSKPVDFLSVVAADDVEVATRLL